MGKGIRAFRTSSIGVESIVFALTASKARYVTYRTANELYLGVQFRDIHVLRAPDYDQFASANRQGWCYIPQSLKKD